MLTAKEKYNHALTLRRAMNAKKTAEETVKAETTILAEYVATTGDKTFRWESGLSLTYVSPSPTKTEPDPKTFMALAQKYMSAADYSACLTQAMKEKKGRSASFR